MYKRARRGLAPIVPRKKLVPLEFCNAINTLNTDALSLFPGNYFSDVILQSEGCSCGSASSCGT